MTGLGVCLTVYGREDHLGRCLASLAQVREQLGGGIDSVTVSDWNLSDISVRSAIEACGEDFERISNVVRMDGNLFSRGAGLNAAAQESPAGELLFLDVDVLASCGAIIEGLSVVSESKAWFPICRDMLKKGGWRWRDNGKGVCAMYRGIFNTVGMWPVYYQWGMEDLQMYNKVADLVEVVRERTDGLVHLYHPPLNSNIKVECRR